MLSQPWGGSVTGQGESGADMFRSGRGEGNTVRSSPSRARGVQAALESASLPEAPRSGGQLHSVLNCRSSGLSLARPPSLLCGKVILLLSSGPPHPAPPPGLPHLERLTPCGLVSRGCRHWGTCLMKTTQFILIALAHLSQSELLLVTDFLLFSVCVVFDCKIRHSFEFMCVLKNKPVLFSMADSPSLWLPVDVFVLQSGENGKQELANPRHTPTPVLAPRGPL